jgi:L-iditol 2-dehydrogenase
MMKAVMKVALGVGNIEVRDIPEPTAGEGQVVIGVRAAGICGTDMHIYKDEFKSRPPVVLGHEISGEIVEVGKGVENLKTGTRVTTETYFYTCGVCRYCRNGQVNLCFERRSIGSAMNGGFTNYVLVPAKNVHPLPSHLSFNAGALTEPLACVVHGVLTTPTVAPGDLAVIAGPGAIGLLTLQVVKAAGAKVIMLGTSADMGRLELAKTLGADYTLNVQEEDAEALVHELSYQGLGADVVYECSGAGPAAAQLLKLVRRKGRYVQIGLFGKSIAFDLDQLCYKELAMSGSNATIPSAWPKALQLLESGAVNTEALISNIYPVNDWQEAFDYFEAKKGIKLLLTPA